MIHSPVPRGSGVEVLHGSLAAALPDYRLQTYSPWWSLVPPVLPLMRARGADLVHASADYGGLFAQDGVPLVVTIHNYTSDRWMRPFSSAIQYVHYRTDLRWLSRMTMARASAVVAISRFVGDLVRSDLGVDPPMHTIYNGVDQERFVPPSVRPPSARFRVLFCGNPNRRKRVHLLPQLAAALGDRFEVHFTEGLGRRHTAVPSPSGKAARLVNLGSVRHSDMPAVYANVELLFMPSVREGFGLCVAEAMACGLPVVACQESAIPELVEPDRGGFLCPVDDIDCYARAIRTLADDRVLASRMGEYNRSRVEEHFTLVRMVRNYRELFTAVMDGAFVQ